MKPKGNNRIVYVTHELSRGLPLAARINITQRIALMKQLGYHVTRLPYRNAWSVNGWRELFRHTRNADILMIRIDGSCIGDTYTLIKLLNPQLRVIWEIHGFPEENAATKRVSPWHLVKKYQRMALSALVNESVYISGELMHYAEKRVLSGNKSIIPNYISPELPHYSSESGQIPTYLADRIKNKFVILWGGSPRFRWQAIDLIDDLSAYVAQIDPLIVFVIVGRYSWHPVRNSRNILSVPRMDRRQYKALMKRADICLALYHKPPQIPLYFFPMKILDYMYNKRPVIASSFPVISTIISHGTDGLLVPNTVQDITFSIMKLKNNPKLRRTMGEAAYRTVRSRYMSKHVQKAYYDVLSRQ